MRSDDGRVVAIVGGGFSGLMLAAQLERRGIGSRIIEQREQVGVGVAYSTNEPRHLLNVASGQMSAWADEPDHFARWFGEADSFAPRRDYRAYLQSVAGTLDPELVKPVRGQAISARRSDGGWEVAVEGREPVRAEALVLAQGNQPPERLPGTEGLEPPLYHNNPWSGGAEADLERAAERGSPVLLIGTGLTMVDSVLSLQAHGHRGEIVAISRRGLVPQSHLVDRSYAKEIAPPPLGDLLALWRQVRRECSGHEWRGPVDALRPHSHAIWRSFSDDDRRRFLRHARPWWDVHRHRIAPEIGATLAELRQSGQLSVLAGRIRRFAVSGDRIEVSWTERGGGEAGQAFGLVVNCTGPLGRIDRSADPLLRNLLDEGEVVADPLRMSIETDERSRAGRGLWAMGPLSKAAFWEIVAVPDLRHQAKAVANDIAGEMWDERQP